MAEKLSVDHLTVEMDVLWGRLKELELTLADKLDTTLKSTTTKLKQHLTPVSARRIGDLVISDELRSELIQLTAYFKAEAGGFVPGDAEKNWLEAEAEVDHFLLEGGAEPEALEVFTGRATPGSIAAARKSVSKAETVRP